MLVYQRVSFFACFKISFPSRCWFSFKMFDPFRAWLCLKNRLHHGTAIPFIGSSIDESSSQLLPTSSNYFMAKRDLFHQSRPESAIFQAKRDGGLPAKSAKVAIMARGKRWPSNDHHEQSVWIRWFSPIFHWFKGKSEPETHGFLPSNWSGFPVNFPIIQFNFEKRTPIIWKSGSMWIKFSLLSHSVSASNYIRGQPSSTLPEPVHFEKSAKLSKTHETYINRPVMACVEVWSSSSTGDLLLHPIARDPKLAPCPAWNVKMYCWLPGLVPWKIHQNPPSVATTAPGAQAARLIRDLD